jgi:hypothetical protein
MGLEFSKINNASFPGEEYVKLDVTRDIQLIGYAIKVVPFHERENVPKHIYHFPDIGLKEGDVVYLYSGVGSKRAYMNMRRSMTYVLFWGLEGCLWDKKGTMAVLMKSEGEVDRMETLLGQ